MDFLSETVKKIPPGDRSSYISETAKRKSPSAGTFRPSDLPGFVNPVVDGKPDTASYIPAAAQDQDSPPILSREEAERQAKKKKAPADVLYNGEMK